MKKVFIFLIKVYQQTLSPDTGWFRAKFPGGYCKYTPSCSEYCKQSIEKHGVVKGGAKGMWRVARCNPWSKGGLDLP
ncbi:MAG: membrane protein insertion efficiency factor YidD [Patescibacteria group bacterium]|nr:membrane protein insertion efficiency factor YidD [Patescibacteria group bacterium]